MSRIRAALALAAVLVALPAATTNPPAPPTGAAPAVMKRYLLQRIDADESDATASALPGNRCSDTDTGYYLYTLVLEAKHLTAIDAALAAGGAALVTAETRWNFVGSGVTTYYEGGDIFIEHTATNQIVSIGSNSSSNTATAPGNLTDILTYQASITPAIRATLAIGDKIHVELAGSSAANTPSCMQTVQLANAEWQLRPATNPDLVTTP